MEQQKAGINKWKSFRYPTFLLIVYYENEWVAPLDFKSRVSKKDIFWEYIPDFKYYLVSIQKYGNDDLLSKEDFSSTSSISDSFWTKGSILFFLCHLLKLQTKYLRVY